jgi:glutamine amidotransferase
VTPIAVVDHGAGNLVSISRGLERAGAAATVATDPDGLEGVAGIVLPGVGATATVMEGIRAHGFFDALRRSRLPLLGICVGMQVLFEWSEEDGADCLGLLGGRVHRLDGAPRLPHIGWNDLAVRPGEPLFDGLGPAPTVYFVHSYAPVPDDPTVEVASAVYGSPFTAAVRAGRVAGTQFHPERSGANGLRILANFVEACRTTEAAA